MSTCHFESLPHAVGPRDGRSIARDDRVLRTDGCARQRKASACAACRSEERLTLAQMSLTHPDLVDAKLTNMFFFDQDDEKYGNLSERVPFTEFFNVSSVYLGDKSFLSLLVQFLL